MQHNTCQPAPSPSGSFVALSKHTFEQKSASQGNPFGHFTACTVPSSPSLAFVLLKGMLPVVSEQTALGIPPTFSAHRQCEQTRTPSTSFMYSPNVLLDSHIFAPFSTFFVAVSAGNACRDVMNPYALFLFCPFLYFAPVARGAQPCKNCSENAIFKLFSISCVKQSRARAIRCSDVPTITDRVLNI